MKNILSKLRNRTPVTIVVVGDSNTVLGMNTQGRLNWVGYLTEALWERYGDGIITMINVSQCGYSYGRLADALESKILCWRPDLVITQLWLGGSGDDPAGYEAAKSGFREVVDRIHASGNGDTDMLVCTPNPRVLCYGHDMPEGAKPGEVWEHPHWNSARNSELIDLAREKGCAVVDHFTPWKDKVYTYAHPGANPRGLWQRMMDPIHPNALGHLVMFREMAPVFDVATHFPWEELGD